MACQPEGLYLYESNALVATAGSVSDIAVLVLVSVQVQIMTKEIETTEQEAGV